MTDKNKQQEVHNHYHLIEWPGSDCSCAGAIILVVFFILIESLATLGALPWQ